MMRVVSVTNNFPMAQDCVKRLQSKINSKGIVNATVTLKESVSGWGFVVEAQEECLALLGMSCEYNLDHLR
jgi:hypothetical protein